MATNKRKENFISKIVKDPANPPKTILLRGYLGDSSEAGHTRLYLDAQLNSYVEVPDDAILHEEELPGTPQGETYVWIKQDAQVIHGEAGPQRRKSSFFEGPIGEAARPLLTAAGCLPPPPRTPAFGCPITDRFIGCQTPVEPCEVLTAVCQPTPQIACPTHPFHGCLTPVRPCVVESAVCPVTSQFQGCLTQVRPCIVQTAICPPEPSVDFKCPTPGFACPPLTPFRGCPVTQDYFGCPPPVTPKFACPITQSRIHCPPPFTPQRGCDVTLELNCQQTPFIPCVPPTPLRGCF